MTTLKNKKKLRRLVRQTSGGVAGQALLTLAMVGMLAAPSVPGAANAAATDDIDLPYTNSTIDGFTFNSNGNWSPTADNSIFGGLTIKAVDANGGNTTLTVGNNTLTFTGPILLQGESSKYGEIIIGNNNASQGLDDETKVFTGGATTIGDKGRLQIGTDGNSTTSGDPGVAVLDSLTIKQGGELLLGGKSPDKVASTNGGGNADLTVKGDFTADAGSLITIGRKGGDAGTYGGPGGGFVTLTVEGMFTAKTGSDFILGGAGGDGSSTANMDGGNGGNAEVVLSGGSLFEDKVILGGKTGADGTGGTHGTGGEGGYGSLTLSGNGKVHTFNKTIDIGAVSGTGANGFLRVEGGASAIFNDDVTVNENSLLTIGDITTGSTAMSSATIIGTGQHFTYLNVESGGSLYIGGGEDGRGLTQPGGAGTLNIGAYAKLTINNNAEFNFGGTGGSPDRSVLTPGFAGGDAILNIQSGGSLIMGGTSFVLQVTQAIGGTGGTDWTDSNTNIVYFGGDGGNATLNIAADAASIQLHELIVGGAGGGNGRGDLGGKGGNGTINIYKNGTLIDGLLTLGGTADTSATAERGHGGTGTLNILAGTTSVGDDLQVGNATAFGGSGVLNIAEGAAVEIINGSYNVTVGSNLSADHAAGTINVAEGGALRLKDGNSITINKGIVTASSYTVGDKDEAGKANTKGILADIMTLDTGALSGSLATLRLKGDLELKNTELAASGLMAGINLTSGTLLVDGKLTLTTASGDISTSVGAGSTVQAQSLAAVPASSVATDKYIWTQGTLKLTGFADADGEFLTTGTGGMAITGGALQLAGSDTKAGGSYAGKLVASNSASISTGTGQWSVNAIDLQGSSTLNVGDKKTISKFTITGDTSGGGDFKSAGTSTVNVYNLGTLEVGYDQLVDSNSAKRATVDQITVSGGGKLLLAGTEGLTISKANLKTLKRDLVSGTGLLDIGKMNITGLTNGTIAYDDVAGITSDALLDTTVILTPTNVANDNIIGGFKNLSIEPSVAGDLTLRTNGTLQLAGGPEGTELVSKKDGKVSISVATDSVLTLGDEDSKGTFGNLSGGVTLAGGTNSDTFFNVINGKFTLGGDVSAVGGNTSINIIDSTLGVAGAVKGGSELNVSNGDLTVGKNATLGDVDLNNANLKAESVTLGNLNLVNGSLITTGKTSAESSAAGNLTINGAVTSGDTTEKRNTITADNTLKVGNFTDGADTNPVLGAVVNTDITAKNMVVNTGGILGTNITMNVEDKLTTNAGISVSGSKVNAGTVDTGSSDVVADKGSTIHFATLDMTKTGDISVVGGSSMTLDSLFTTNGKLVSVGKADETAGSNLIIGNLNSGANGATFFANSSAANVLDKSFIQVQAINNATGTKHMNDVMIAGNGSILSFGKYGKEWTTDQMKLAGSSASSVLVIGMPVTVGTSGKILVGDQWNAAQAWSGAAVNPATLDVRGNSLIIVDRSAVQSGVGIVLNSTNNTVNIDSTASLRLSGGQIQANNTYTLVSGISHADGSVTQSNLQDPTVKAGGALTLSRAFSNYLLIDVGGLKYTAGTANDGTLSVDTKLVKANSVLPRLSGSMGSYLDGMALSNGFDSHSTNAGVRFVSRALDRDFIGSNDVDLAAVTLEGATQVASIAGVQGSTFSVANASSGVAATRTSFAQPLMDTSRAVAVLQDSDNILRLDGLSAGDGMNNGFALWVMPMYQADRVSGMKSGSFKSGYNSDFGGMALGADYTFANAWRVGAALNVGGGHSRSKGDFSKTTNNYNFWGLSLYGGWTMNNFGLSADLGYTSAENDVKHALPSALGMDSLKSDADSSAWTIGAKAEYKIDAAGMEIVPYIGVRYTGLNTSSYSAKSAGETVFRMGSHDQSVFTFPMGVNIAKTIETGSGWKIRPQAQLGIIPAAGDLKARSTASIPTIAGSTTSTMNVVDSFTFDGGLGVDVIKDNLSFGLKYNIQASQHRTGHGVFATLRYEF